MTLAFLFGLDLFSAKEFWGNGPAMAPDLHYFLFCFPFFFFQIDWRRDLSIGSFGCGVGTRHELRELTTARSAGNRGARAVVGTNGWA